MKLKIFYRIILVLFFVSSCYKEPEVINIKKVDIVNLKGNTLSLKIKSLVSNPNNFKLKANNIKLKFNVENSLIGSSNIKSKMVLSPKSKKYITLPAKIFLENLSEQLPKLIKKDSFPVKISIKADFSSLKIPVHANTTRYFKGKELINNIVSGNSNSMSLKDVSLLKTTLDTTVLRVNILFKNDMPISYKILSIKSRIYNNSEKEELMGISKMTKRIFVKKGREREIPLKIAISNFKTLKGLFGNVLKNKRTVFLHSDVTIHIGKYKFKIPFEQEIDIPKPKIF